jgi:cytochrome c-type biogenesis protein CcmH
MKQQRYDDAARAYANSIRLNGETPDRVAGFAEALVLTNNGLIVPDARRAYQRLLKIAPDRPEPRFWLALAKEQDGDLAGGIADLDGMLKSAPGDAPWRSLVEGKLNEMRTALAGGGEAKVPSTAGKAIANSDAQAGGVGSDSGQGAVTQAGPRGPRAADVAAVQQMSPEERSAFIAQMVEGLAARLAKNGNDLEGWKRLARAYKVMGRHEDAAKALSDARRAMADDGAALKALDALAKDLGIGT